MKMEVITKTCNGTKEIDATLKEYIENGYQPSFQHTSHVHGEITEETTQKTTPHLYPTGVFASITFMKRILEDQPQDAEIVSEE